MKPYLRNQPILSSSAPGDSPGGLGEGGAGAGGLGDGGEGGEGGSGGGLGGAGEGGAGGGGAAGLPCTLTSHRDSEALRPRI